MNRLTKFCFLFFFPFFISFICTGQPPKPASTLRSLSPVRHNPKIGSKEIITVRHGTTHAMVDHKVQGDLDGAQYRLNDQGKSEAKNVANHLKQNYPNVQTIISCGKKRCAETAAQISAKYPRASVWHEGDRARGTNMGEMNGKKYNEAFFANPNWRNHVKGVEDESHVQERYKDLTRDLISSHPHQSKSEHLFHVAGPEIPEAPNQGSPHRTVLVSHQWTNHAIADLIHNNGNSARLGNGVDINKKEGPAGHSVIHLNNPDSFARDSHDGRINLNKIPKDQVLIKKKGN